MSDRVTACPRCGAEALEACLAVWVDRVQLEKVESGDPHEWRAYRLVEGDPSGSADTGAGLVVSTDADAFYVRCADCDHALTDTTEVAHEFADRWTFRAEVAA